MELFLDHALTIQNQTFGKRDNFGIAAHPWARIGTRQSIGSCKQNYKMSEQVNKQSIIEENRSHDKDTGSERSANRIAYLPDFPPYGTFENSPQGLSLPQRTAYDGGPQRENYWIT